MQKNVTEQPTAKILLLSVSAGAGHTRAAQALLVSATNSVAGVSATHLDVMNFVPPWFRKIYTDFYISLVNKYPSLWGYLYRASNNIEPNGFIQRIRRLVEHRCTSALRHEIAAQKPDAIICSHFLPAELMSRAISKSKINGPVWVLVTDFDLHRIWVQPHMRGYFTANSEVAFRLKAYGIVNSAIHVTGIPVMPIFADEFDRNVCAHEAGLDASRAIVILMGGGEGIGSLDILAAQILSIDVDFQLIVMAGRNTDALAKLQVLAQQFPGRLNAQGFTDKIERLMACADFAITKPGGLTSSECLAIGLPMIVNAPIPGQEEHNADYLLEQGVALKAFDTVTLQYRVRQLLHHPEQLAEMRMRARALGRKHAAQAVLNIVLSDLQITHQNTINE